MTAWKDMGSASRALWLGGGAVAAAAAGAAIWSGLAVPVPAPTAPAPVAVETAADAPAEAPAPAAAAPAAPAVPEPAVAEVPLAPPAAAAGDAAGTPVAESAPAVSSVEPDAAAAQPALPAFDVLRVSPEGDAVIAGQAEPRSAVLIRVDGAEVARADADAQGKFVSLFTLPPSAVARIVTLQSVLADGRMLTSAESVILAPTPAAPPVVVADAADPAPEEVVAGTAGDTAPKPAVEAATEADQVVAAAAPLAEDAPIAEDVPAAVATGSAPEPAPPAALLVSEGGARVLQAAGGAGIDPRNVTIDAISYSTKGDVQLSGRGQSEGFVRLYLDNEPLMDTEIAPDGTWGGTLPVVAAGQYMLRADQIDAQGAVLSRYETPFQRESPEVLAAAAPDGADAPMAAKITVQPGFTLWGIAKQNYGSGVMYVQVYEANKAMIGDPDLIYPGQVFNVPARDPGP